MQSIGYDEISRSKIRPPGVAPGLYPSLGTWHFDDSVLHPRAEESMMDVVPFSIIIK